MAAKPSVPARCRSAVMASTSARAASREARAVDLGAGTNLVEGGELDGARRGEALAHERFLALEVELRGALRGLGGGERLGGRPHAVGGHPDAAVACGEGVVARAGELGHAGFNGDGAGAGGLDAHHRGAALLLQALKDERVVVGEVEQRLAATHAAAFADVHAHDAALDGCLDVLLALQGGVRDHAARADAGLLPREEYEA
jgi:hypothetical protein